MGKLTDLLMVYWSYANNHSVEVFTQEIKAITGDWEVFKVNGKARNYRHYKAIPSDIARDTKTILSNPDKLTLCV
jgi:hypothetical protein